MMPRYYPHTFGGGLILGLLASGRPWLAFAAGVVVGLAGLLLLVLGLRTLRRARRVSRLAGRWLERAAGESPREAPLLTDEELEQVRREGLRQGTAAGVRAAAREEIRDRAKRQAMSEALEEHWREERHRSVARAVRGRS